MKILCSSFAAIPLKLITEFACVQRRKKHKKLVENISLSLSLPVPEGTVSSPEGSLELKLVCLRIWTCKLKPRPCPSLRLWWWQLSPPVGSCQFLWWVYGSPGSGIVMVNFMSTGLWDTEILIWQNTCSGHVCNGVSKRNRHLNQ